MEFPIWYLYIESGPWWRVHLDDIGLRNIKSVILIGYKSICILWLYIAPVFWYFEYRYITHMDTLPHLRILINLSCDSWYPTRLIFLLPDALIVAGITGSRKVVFYASIISWCISVLREVVKWRDHKESDVFGQSCAIWSCSKLFVVT